MIKLITSARFIGELIDDLDISTSSYVNRFYSWIEYGLGIMDLSKYYSLQSKIVEIDNYKGLLPCDAKFIHSIWTQGLGNDMAYISTSSSPLVGQNFEGYPVANNRVNVDGYYINSDVKKAKVLIVYRGIPRDSEGFPLVPDNPLVFEALMYYIIYRLALRGVTHPIVGFQDALTLWERMYPRASNDVNWMTLPEYEEFTAFWNSPYNGNMINQLYDA